MKIGLEHLTGWERAAVVTDVDWIKHLVNAFRFMMPVNLRVFPAAQASEARALAHRLICSQRRLRSDP